MKIIFACGGTAGHINPAIAVAETIRTDKPDTEIKFIGNPNRMEADLVPQAGYPFIPLVVEGFHRSFKPSSIVHNIKSVWYAISATYKVKQILKEEQPDVVMGTGGYVSGPVLRTASKMGIKTITHESNAYPGVTTKILTKYVDAILLAEEDSKTHLPEGKNYIVTGNPVRPEILSADREQSRRLLGVEDKVCVLSYGGSNGAERINSSMAYVIAKLQPKNKTHHIHATGRFGVETFPAEFKEYGGNLDDKHLDLREYINNMDLCLAAADLVVCRAGAMALSELKAVGRASVLIPSPNVAENHQYHNAMALAHRNAAIVVEEKDLTGEMLLELVTELVADPVELSNISSNAKTIGITDGAKRIAHEIYKLYEE